MATHEKKNDGKDISTKDRHVSSEPVSQAADGDMSTQDRHVSSEPLEAKAAVGTLDRHPTEEPVS